MTMLEDKLRAALRETAAEIPAHSVPALRLPEARRRLRLPPAGARQRWPHGLTPLAAAVTVAGVVAASVIFAGAFGSQHPGTRPSGQAGPFAGLPPYYVVLTGRHPRSFVPQRQAAVVRATATGKVLATIPAPEPYATVVAAAGAGDGRTFVLGAARWVVRHHNGGTDVLDYPVHYFLLRIGADGSVAPLTPLPIPAQPGPGVAVSPDGSKLALYGDTRIQVFSLATGAERTWTWPGRGRITNNAAGDGEVLSWTADGRMLAFQQWVGSSIDVRLLDTVTSGGSLQRDSRLVLQWKGDAETWHFVHGKISNVIFGFSAIITPDGSKIVAATASQTQHPLSSELAFTEFSARTGKPVATLGRWPLPGLYPGQTQDVLWSNTSGSTLIVLAHKPGPAVPDPRSFHARSAGYGIEFGVLTGNGFTPLPGLPSPGPNPWPVW